MALDVPLQSPLVLGLVLAVLGVGFWVGGLVVANYFYKRFREEEAEE